MSYIFPYWMVERGSRIALYGFGRVGQEFFMQLNIFGYAECVLVTDQSFINYGNVKAPFAHPKALTVVDYDYVVIAVLNKKIANGIKNEIISICGGNLPEERIIWSEFYAMEFNNWSINKTQYLSNPDFFAKIAKKYFDVSNANWDFTRCQFYQSYSELGIAGIRNSQERIAIYRCRELLKTTDHVLDIGCNCGFLDLQIAPYVNHITGLDVQKAFIEIANETKAYTGTLNATFLCADYAHAEIKESFNAIFALAVHSNIITSDVTEEQYVGALMKNLTADGYLFFESHDLTTDRIRYRRLVEKLCSSGMEILRMDNYRSDFEREITILRKTL